MLIVLRSLLHVTVWLRSKASREQMFENILPPWRNDNIKHLQKMLRSRAKRLRRERALELEEYGGEEPNNVKVYEDSQELKKIKDFGPEDTYEIWLQEKHVNKNFDKFIEKPVKRAKKNPNEELFQTQDNNNNNDDPSDNNDGDDINSEDDIESPDEDSTDGRFALAKGRYKIKKQGLEILPHFDAIDENDKTASFILANKLPYSRKHIFVLTKLLHLNILKRNWKTAYKCFSILIRIQIVDVRSVWPLGIEVLTRIAEENYKSTQPENSVSSYQLRTLKSQDLSSSLGQFKDEQFLTWLENFHPPWISKSPLYLALPQAYKISTKNTPPTFVLNLIWTLIMKQDFQKINDKLSEMLLHPPYINDGTFFFLQGFSYQLEASQLCKESPMDKSKIEILVADAKKYFKEAKDLNADFPEDLVERELNHILREISNIDMSLDDDDEKMDISDFLINSDAVDQFIGSPGVKREGNVSKDLDIDMDGLNGDQLSSSP